jgi:peptide deformylase
MSDLIVFDTEELVKIETEKPKIKLLNLVSEDDPILKQVLPEFDFTNSPVDPNAFASSLVETCKALKGIGLSANQCGYPYRVFVMGADDTYVAFFNPKIISKSINEIHLIEGCLSFPLLGLRITRPESIHVQYQDFNGVKREQTFYGISSRCFQHELDHMNGILYTSRVKPLALEIGMKKRKKLTSKITSLK